MRPVTLLHFRLVAIARVSIVLVTVGILSTRAAASDVSVRAPLPTESKQDLLEDRDLPALGDVLARLREYEAVWANAEFFVRRRYELIKRVDPRWTDLVLVSEKTRRCVYQGEQAYVESAALHKFVDGSSTSAAGVSAFDGHHTTSIDADRDGMSAVILDYGYPKRLVLPHTLLLEHERIAGPLHEFLTNASREAPHFETEIIGYERVSGLKCIKVRKRSWRGQGPRLDAEWVLFWDLWLAIDRCYLPIRLELSYSNGNLVSEAVTTQLAQAQSGTWYPQSISVSGFGTEHGVRIPARSYEYAVQNIRLDPHYAPEFFRSVSIPPGARVRIVRDGKTVEGFIQPEEPEE